MPDRIEVETTELHQAVQEIHEEQAREQEREKADAKERLWTRYIALSTAFLAVFAAIGSLQAAYLVNDAMILQIKAADTWAQYQSDRLKTHLYTLGVNSLLDQSAAAAPQPHEHAQQKRPRVSSSSSSQPSFVRMSASERVASYENQIQKETTKTDGLSKEAQNLEKESAQDFKRHHVFEACVALIQIAIALSAVAALTRIRWVWYGSMGLGLIGLGLLAYGFLHR